MEESIWKKEVRKDASAKDLGPCHRVERGVYTKKGKVYSLLREEREEVQKFVEDQLRKGYIRPSKLPQMLPVHFVAKKDGTRRMVQDYQYLNQ